MMIFKVCIFLSLTLIKHCITNKDMDIYIYIYNVMDIYIYIMLQQVITDSKVPPLRNSILRKSGLIFPENMLCYEKLNKLYIFCRGSYVMI